MNLTAPQILHHSKTEITIKQYVKFKMLSHSKKPKLILQGNSNDF